MDWMHGEVHRKKRGRQAGTEEFGPRPHKVRDGERASYVASVGLSPSGAKGKPHELMPQGRKCRLRVEEHQCGLVLLQGSGTSEIFFPMSILIILDWNSVSLFEHLDDDDTHLERFIRF